MSKPKLQSKTNVKDLFQSFTSTKFNQCCTNVMCYQRVLWKCLSGVRQISLTLQVLERGSSSLMWGDVVEFKLLSACAGVKRTLTLKGIGVLDTGVAQTCYLVLHVRDVSAENRDAGSIDLQEVSKMCKRLGVDRWWIRQEEHSSAVQSSLQTSLVFYLVAAFNL